MSNVEKPIGVALSGGGYRAALFSLGSLWRMNELGLLKKLDCVTSVSGSSITSALLAMKWKKLNFDDADVADNFKEVVATPLQTFCSNHLDIIAIILGMLTPGKTTGDVVAEMYSKRLFGSKTLDDLPSGEGCPMFIFYATSMQTGASVRFSQDYISDWKIGKLAGR